jgi:hypothetical protein
MGERNMSFARGRRLGMMQSEAGFAVAISPEKK